MSTAQVCLGEPDATMIPLQKFHMAKSLPVEKFTKHLTNIQI